MLIQPDEDGNPVRFLDQQKLDNLLANPADYGIKRFLPEIPTDMDTNYWLDGTALLVSVELITPIVNYPTGPQ